MIHFVNDAVLGTDPGTNHLGANIVDFHVPRYKQQSIGITTTIIITLIITLQDNMQMSQNSRLLLWPSTF